MARFALFMGQDYEASGGWEDLAHIGTIEECKEKALAIDPENPRFMPDWAHIVDLDAGKEVLYLKFEYEPEPVLTADRGKKRNRIYEWVEKFD